jgi:L-threonylcarbamoyladenylate synthase
MVQQGESVSGERRTELLDAIHFPEESVSRAAELLRAGEIVAFPTETVYGLGAGVFHEVAIREVFRAKGRPQDNPLIVHIASMSDVERVALHVPPLFHILSAKFFPGPLTIVVDKHPAVPDSVTAGLPGVAIRMPDHPVAMALIKAAGEPLVAPSANRSGQPSPTSARHVLDDLEGRIAAVVDGGECEVGIESTVISLRGKNPVILRPGIVTREQLEAVTGLQIEYANQQQGETPAAPGMKYRHYAPDAKIILVTDREEAQQRIRAADKKVRVLANVDMGNVERRPLLAKTLYAEFREADADGIRELILVCDDEIRNDAGLMNRIKKAAEG